MPDYNGYRLSNSTQVEQYPGSVLPEVYQVGQELQGRYDQSLQNTSILRRALKTATALPQDNPLFNELVSKYEGRLQERAGKGDYENMWRDTAMDVVDFADEYKPIAENYGRMQAYQKQLNDDVEKGKITPEKAQLYMKASNMYYKGLQRDKAGRYSGYFSGMQPMKDIDLPKKIDDWMDNFAPQVIGTKAFKIGDQWVTKTGSKTEKLTQEQIDAVMAAGARLDPEFKSWLRHEQELKTLGAEQADIGSLPVAMQQKITAKAQELGISPGQVFKMAQQQQIEQDIWGNMRQYSSKHVVNNRTTESDVVGNPYGEMDYRKKLEDKVNPLSVQILQPDGRQKMDPVKVDNLISGLSQEAVNVKDQYSQWLRSNGVKPVGDRYIDAQNNDVSGEVSLWKQRAAQADAAAFDLARLKSQAIKESGYTVTPELEKKAQENAKAAYDGWIAGVGRMGASTNSEDTKKQAEDASKRAYDQTLRNTKGYQRYEQILAEKSKAASTLIGVTTFAQKSANESAENNFKNLALNLDKDGLKFGAIGLQWASGKAAGTELSADDYAIVRDEAKFVGTGIDADGELKFFFKVGKVTRNTKGTSVGEEAVVKMPAMPGTIETLIKSGQTDASNIILGQQITKALAANSRVGFAIDPRSETKIIVDANSAGAGQAFTLILPGGDGHPDIRVPVNSVGEAVNTITTAVRNAQARQKDK